MELEAVGVPSNPKALVHVERTPGEMDRVRREVERVRMPVHYRERGARASNDRILQAFSGQAYFTEADFWSWSSVHASAQRGCKKLGSQTDAQNGEVVLDRSAEQPLFGEEIGTGVCVVDPHRATHDDETSHRLDCGDGVAAIQPTHVDRQSARPGLGRNDPGAFPGDVLKDGPDSRHLANRFLKGR